MIFAIVAFVCVSTALAAPAPQAESSSISHTSDTFTRTALATTSTTISTDVVPLKTNTLPSISSAVPTMIVSALDQVMPTGACVSLNNGKPITLNNTTFKQQDPTTPFTTYMAQFSNGMMIVKLGKGSTEDHATKSVVQCARHRLTTNEGCDGKATPYMFGTETWTANCDVTVMLN
ncbi:hypothetical protein BC830DRAFT_1079670 [Chytriomyces sp. MP71]|nr:hypothetical protein BC830DRAFT_1079670 [Chytriomyces sp. MP71]